jgi:predicted RNA methylase
MTMIASYVTDVGQTLGLIAEPGRNLQWQSDTPGLAERAAMLVDLDAIPESAGNPAAFALRRLRQEIPGDGAVIAGNIPPDGFYKLPEKPAPKMFNYAEEILYIDDSGVLCYAKKHKSSAGQGFFEWKEDEQKEHHPRDEHGLWTKQGGGAGGGAHKEEVVIAPDGVMHEPTPTPTPEPKETTHADLVKEAQRFAGKKGAGLLAHLKPNEVGNYTHERLQTLIAAAHAGVAAAAPEEVPEVIPPEVSSGDDEDVSPVDRDDVSPVHGDDDLPPESPRVALANVLAAKLGNGETVTAKSLLEDADAAYGGTRAEGKHDPSGVYDSLEAGFNKSLIGKTDPKADLAGAIAQVEALAKQVGNLPTQTNRSGNKDAFQQFSTPPHYALAVAWLANLTDTDLVLEPTAGTGCLATQAANAGAMVHANELDPKRAELLKDIFGEDRVTQENAEQLGAILPKAGIVPTAVVMNPPFSQTAGRMGDKRDLMAGANHISEALQALAPGGRLVAIVGGGVSRDGAKKAGMSPESSTYSKWFADLAKDGYDLRANVGVSGDEYKKYGTNFGT